jgi:hypothetical protein
MPSLINVDGISSYTLAEPVLINDQFEIGPFNNATGSFAFASGLQTVASGNHSSSQGFATTASGDKSHAEGDNTTANGYASHSEGWYTNANGNYSHAEGNNTTASAQTAHAEGGDTTASGISSHAEGILTTSSGNFSHAEGSNTIANGQSSHAEGGETTANGIAAHAEGISAIANGNGSHAEGHFTIADGNYSHVTGRYNLSNTTEGAFIIGNGTSGNNRSNLLLAAANEVEVFGKTSTETIKISNGAFDGYVLTSDALGNGTWQSIGALTDTFVTAASLNGTDLEIDRNNGQPQIVVDLSSLVTPPGIDTFVTNAGLNGLTLEIDRNQGQPQLTVDLSSLAVDTNNYLTDATLNGTLLELDRFGLSTLTVDLASINTDTFVVSGVYDDVSNTITLTRNDAGTIDITGIADSYVTGAALNGSTLELTRNEGLPTLFVDLSSLLDDTTATVDAAADPNVNVDVVFYSASTPGGTIYLNSALNVAGKKIVLIRKADTNSVTLAGSGGAQINGSGTKALPTALYSTTTCISDGANWYCTNGAIL